MKCATMSEQFMNLLHGAAACNAVMFADWKVDECWHLLTLHSPPSVKNQGAIDATLGARTL